MKNLKKVLALVLTVAMVLSFTIAAGAFSDTTTYAKNTEAVDVMSMLKVINGYSDGTFKGDKNVTRAEMAKMICYIISSGDDVGSIYAGANTFTDCTSHWAKGYIAYAAKTGLVAGIGNGKFDPNGNVTGTQAAKMLLCALGYSATNEKYVGANWDVNVLAKADEIGLLDSLTATDMSKALTRADAAQMMFNALKGTMVKYSTGGTTVTTKDGTVVTTGASTADEVANKSFDYRETTTSEATKTAGTQQLCEKYFKDLKFVSDADNFARPADKWTFGDSTVTAPKTATVTYTAEVKGKQIYADLGKTTCGKMIDHTYTTYFYRDGKLVSTNSANVSKLTSTNTDTFNQNGLLSEIYVDKDNNKVTVVSVDTILAQVNSINTSDKENLSVKFTSNKLAKAITDTEDNSGLDFSKLAEDDYVLLTAYTDKAGTADYQVASIATPKTVEGTMSAFKLDSSVTVAGTKYTVQNNFDDIGGMLANDGDFDGTYTLYLDTYGNAIASVLKEASSANATYLYFARGTNDVAASAYSAIDGNAYVKMAVTLSDGTSKVINLYVKNPAKTTAQYYLNGSYVDVTSSIKSSDFVQGWYSYTTTSDGQYKLTKVATIAETNADAYAVEGTGISYTSNAATITTGGQSRKATSTTTLNLLDSTKTYTGYKNFIDYTKITNKDTAKTLFVLSSKGSSTVKAIYVAGDGSIAESVTIAYLNSFVGKDSTGYKYEVYVDGKAANYYSDTKLGIATGTVVKLTNIDSGNKATFAALDNTASSYTGTPNYAVVTGKTVNSVESTDYFAIDDGSNPDIYFNLANSDENITCGIYDVTGDTVAAGKLAKSDTVTIAYVTIGSEKYAVAVYITD